MVRAKSAWLKAVLGLGMAVAAWETQAIEVLLLWDNPVGVLTGEPQVTDLNPETQALIAALETGGEMSVTLSRNVHHEYDGNLPAPDDFDVVLHLSGGVANVPQSEIDQSMATGPFHDLIEYVRAGGGFVSESNNAYRIESFPSLFFLGTLAPIEVNTSLPTTGPTLEVTPVPAHVGHPIFDGLTAPFEFSGTALASTVRTYGSNPVTELATDQNGNTAVAIRLLDDGRIVGFHHRGNYEGPNDFSQTLTDPVAQALFVNAVRWADQTPPQVTAIELEGPPATAGPDVSFRVLFREAVTGVDASDFVADPVGLTIGGGLVVTAVSPKEYLVTATGLSGSGTLGLALADDDSIQDLSDSAISLVGASGADGSFSAPLPFVVDALLPSVVSVSTNPVIASTGDTPQVIVDFDEPMNISISPVVAVVTMGNGTIPLGSGVWLDSDTWSLTLARALTNLDAGLVTVNITDARDVLGNVMGAYSDTPFSFGALGLTATLSAAGDVSGQFGNEVNALLGGDVTISASVSGQTGDVNYEWKHVTIGNVLETVGDNAPQLLLTDITTADNGVYYCIVSDDVDTVTSTELELTAVEALPAAQAPCLLALALLAAGVFALRRTRPGYGASMQ